MKLVVCSECGVRLYTPCLSFLDGPPTCKDHEREPVKDLDFISLDAHPIAEPKEPKDAT